jgi:hypothetical protein
VCRDFGSGLNCTCPDGFTGVGCQYEFNACAESACQNGATCVPGDEVRHAYNFLDVLPYLAYI